MVDDYISFATELGQKVTYDTTYNPKRLVAIPRDKQRDCLGLANNKLPFVGFDVWNHYEVSWLNIKGKPQVALAKVSYSCASPYLVESKSFKLYCNSFNNSKFASKEAVARTMEQDLANILQTKVVVELLLITSMEPKFQGENIDDLDITCDTYQVEPKFLTVVDDVVTEVLYSDLLRSNCPVTKQPDWGSVQLSYTGPTINRESLLRYIVSFRNNTEFHEQCVERIFCDVMTYCKPSMLVVHGRYTRRGGIDINPIRATPNVQFALDNIKLQRQ